MNEDHIIKKLPLNIPYNSRSGRGMMNEARRKEIEEHIESPTYRDCDSGCSRIFHELLTEIDRLNKQLEQFRLHGLGEK